MISEEAYETIRSFADLIFQRELGAVRHRVSLRNALGELLADRQRGQELAVMADPDSETGQQVADAALVDDAVRKHHVEGLRYVGLSARPSPGDLWPTSTYAQAQWHLIRAQLLQAAPVEVAAAMLREEVLAALDTNPKDEGP